MRRILVVEDNADLAFGLRNNLEIEGYDVAVARDGASGLAAAVESPPDLVVLDLMLPDMDGLKVLRRLRSRGVQSPVLVLTARGEEADKVRGLKLGADDYVTKPFGLLELLARVEAMLRRRQATAAPAERFGAIEVDRAARRVLRDGEPVALTPLELELLLALLDARGAAVSRLELLRRVWGYSGAAVTRTVDTHVAELRRKLETRPRAPRHIVTVRKVGYRLDTGGTGAATQPRGSPEAVEGERGEPR